MSEELASLLLVDDDQDHCRVLARALARRQFAVRLAHSAAEALLLAEAEPPEYALIDLNMPGDSGLTLIPRLLALDAQTRIVVLTGYASVATAVEAIKLGAIHYLAKPADADSIVKAFAQREGNPALPVASQPQSVDRLEWEHIQRVLLENAGNISETARQLNMHRRTLQRKLAKYPPRC
ncbi:response regulator transcription factor [Chitinimonas sp.]|uniref:response regulator transcription factor n=1 Tax=Chitinimonas sp. TaxID=1934313 RepID=UPI0035AD9B37